MKGRSRGLTQRRRRLRCEALGECVRCRRVSLARRRGYALQRLRFAPVAAVRHFLGFAAESDARVGLVPWRSFF
jgi:hypothetical protein